MSNLVRTPFGNTISSSSVERSDPIPIPESLPLSDRVCLSSPVGCSSRIIPATPDTPVKDNAKRVSFESTIKDYGTNLELTSFSKMHAVQETFVDDIYFILSQINKCGTFKYHEQVVRTSYWKYKSMYPYEKQRDLVIVTTINDFMQQKADNFRVADSDYV